jgi:hypothetical protein
MSRAKPAPRAQLVCWSWRCSFLGVCSGLTVSRRRGFQPISVHAGNVFRPEKPRRDYSPPASLHDPHPGKAACGHSPVPQGRERIAQRFIAGSKSRERTKSRRDERNERTIGISGASMTRKMAFNFLRKHGLAAMRRCWRALFRPSGTRHGFDRTNPAMNRWAIFFRPLGWKADRSGQFPACRCCRGGC